MKLHLLLPFISLTSALPAPSPVLSPRADEVIVAVSSSTIIGTTAFNVDSFRGIPFADPPIGPLRLKPPRKLSTPLEAFNATGPASACPQMFISSSSRDTLSRYLVGFLDLPLLQEVTGQEDCLTVTVQRPAGTTAGDGLPVLFWIFGGGFELGSSAMYDGTSLLGTAIEQGQPFVLVAVNYRVAGFGFMPGKEVLKDGSANLGLLDQRMALEWVADNIASFGGDPRKVTIWGESAGAISVFDQLALYGGNATYKNQTLFRGAIMNSGSVVPASPVDGPKGQAIYDSVVLKAGCSNSTDSLNCLRNISYDAFLEASNSVPGILSYNSVALSYLPRPDGTVLPDSPDILATTGRYHAVPMIVGDQEDEGTLFALFQPNITDTTAIVDYLSSLFFASAPKENLTTLVNLYPNSPTEGSPFRTGLLNELYPGYKRLAAILGDLVFTLTRRYFLQTAKTANPSTPTWSYLASYNYGTPILGTFHGSDLLQVFFGILPNNAMRSIRTYYFNFLYNLDPNQGVGGYAEWPEWGAMRELMWFETPSMNGFLNDSFREEAFDWIVDNVHILQI